MTKSKNTKSALLLSVLSMMLCCAMLVGSTFAWFTDSVTSGMNKIVAGNLDVELYHSNGSVEPEAVTATTILFLDKDGKDGSEFKWEPGAMLYENFTVKNAGTLALKYKLILNAESPEEGISLDKVLKVAVVDGTFDGTRATAMNLKFDKTVAEFVEGGAVAATGALAAKGESTCAIIIYWEPSDIDNDYNFNNGKTGSAGISLGINLIAMQAASESDSLGNDYDANANGEPGHSEWGTITSDKMTVSVNPDGATVINSENISVSIPQGVAAGDSLTLTCKPTDIPGGITVESNQTSKSFDISVEGLKADNETDIEVKLFVGKNLEGVTLYHHADPVEGAAYDSKTGIITFKTNSFSPFTAVFNKVLTVYEVTPENIQEYLSGEHGSMSNAKLILAPGNYGKLLIGLPSKYAGGDTVYTCLTGNNHSNEPLSFTDSSEFLDHLSTSNWHTTPNYLRTIENLTIVGQEGVTVEGLLITSGHAYGTGAYDPVREKTVNGSCYYMTQKITNLTFKDVTFTAKCDIATSEANTVIDGVTFDSCSFTTGGIAASNGQGLRYYNENNNGNVKNLTVKKCSFNNCYQGIYTSNINGITVSKCTFDTTGHNAIAIQSGAHGAVNHKAVVIEENFFNNIGDRIIRFGDIDADTQITIKDNVALNSGDSVGEVIKAQSLAEGIIFEIGINNWGEDTTVANSEFESVYIDEGDMEDPFG